jgi:uncharacterized glyoxalase superfamily protein PhnB
MAMKPRVTILTLGVEDVERAMKFYGDGLGLPTQGIVGTEFEHGKVAFFDLADGMKLAVFARDDLALDAQIARAPASPTEFSIGHNVNSKKEVDAIMVEARKAGARITKGASDTFWGGYSGYFQDLDGHLWEIMWNPSLSVPD